MRRLFQSLIFRAGITMAGITLLAIASMVASVTIADTARGDTASINLAGTLRMQAYRIAITLLQQPTDIQAVREQVWEFQTRLDDPQLVQHVEANAEAASTALHTVTDHWRTRMRPALDSLAGGSEAATAAYMAELDSFVGEVDHLVDAIRQEADARLAVLRMVQGIALFLTVGLVFVAMYKLLADVAPPLREMFAAFERARTGDFSIRPDYRGHDEIGLLSQTYSRMAVDLSRLYENLEQRVNQKTAALSRSNQALQLLYDTTRQLNWQSMEADDYRVILDKVAQVLGIDAVTLCLTTENADRAYRSITGGSGRPPAFCNCQDCAGCLVSERLEGTPGTISFPVGEGGYRYGVILVRAEPELETWQRELLEAVAAHIATALRLARQREQQHRLALMDERAVIARELHDSLAQSLSYLKIQVVRLQTLMAQADENPAMAEVINELKEGLSSAYRQLRELLSTFRLKMNEPGLRPALESTMVEFSQRGSLQVELDYRLEHCPLTPNEEVHVLQIVREAMANVLHHAKAGRAEVSLSTTEAGGVRVVVADDGVGMPDNWQRRNHYGVTIMRERALSLGGELRFERRAQGGTRVELRFMPAAGGMPPAPSAPESIVAVS